MKKLVFLLILFVSSITTHAQMSGIYTINNTMPTAGSNYASFSAAVSALNSLGVSAPVTFNVANGQIFTEQIDIPAISGASTTNTITFIGNNSTLTYAASSSAARHTLRLNGTEFFRFNKLNINATGTTYGHAVHLYNQANNNIFDSCSINMPLNNSTTIVGFAISSQPDFLGITGSFDGCDNNVLSNSTIIGGAKGVALYGKTSNRPNTNQVINNTIQDFNEEGIRVTNTENTLISKNDISRPTRLGGDDFYGIRTGADFSVFIEKNHIHNPFQATTSSTNSARGIFLAGILNASSVCIIENNLIEDFDNAGAQIGIQLSTWNFYTHLQHNTIALQSLVAAATSSDTTIGILNEAYTIGLGLRIENNNITITRAGNIAKYGININVNTSTVCNYNNIYMNGPGSGNIVGRFGSTDYVTLANWQTVNSNIWGQNSISVDPQYTNIATNDYTPTNYSLFQAATPLGLADDFLDSARSPTAPTIGAFEMIGCPPLAGTYTINPALPASGTNYQSFNAVRNDLCSCGISTPVVFNVASGQTFNERVDFCQVFGASSTNTITFNGNGSTITSNDTTVQVATIRLNGSDYFRFNNLTIEHTDTNYYAVALKLLGSANENIFDTCTFRAPRVMQLTAYPSNYASYAVWFEATDSLNTTDNNVIRNSLIEDGRAGISMTGYSLTDTNYMANGNVIENNTFSNNNIIALHASGINNLTIGGNDFNRSTLTNSPFLASTHRSIYIQFHGNILIEKNHLHNPWPFIINNKSYAGMDLGDGFSYSTPTAGTALVRNNLIDNIKGNNFEQIGILVGNQSDIKIQHNTIVFDDITNPTTTTATEITYGIRVDSMAGGPALNLNCEITNNNIFMGRAGVDPMFGLIIMPRTTVCDYNNIYGCRSNYKRAKFGHVSYFPTPYLHTDHADLASWQTANGGAWGQNSLEEYPAFVNPSISDYHPANTSMDNAGSALGITTDYLGAPRSATTPDMGAFEFIGTGVIQPIVFVSVTDTTVGCNGDSTAQVNLQSAFGVPSYTYTLTPGSVTNTTGSYVNLPAGAYSINVADASGCTSSISFAVSQPPVLNIDSISGTNPSCTPGGDGTIVANISGGTSGYQYNIGGANQTSNTFNGLSAAIYVVTVTDTNGCTDTMSITLSVPPVPVITSTLDTNVSCNGANDGSAAVTATGASAISYTLTPGSIINTSGYFNNLSPNTYTITASDASNCTVSTMFTISQSAVLTIDSLTASNPTCLPGVDGSIVANISGGTPGYQYSIGGANQTSNTFNNLSAATYVVTVTDTNACADTMSITFTVPPVPVITSTLGTNVSCNGSADGSIVVTGTGASAITFTLNPGAVSNSTGYYNNLAPNTYTITLSDASNCTVSTTLTITEPTILNIDSLSASNPTCSPGGDGSIVVNISGGTLVYQYNIGGANQASNVFNNVGSGIYTVTVTDANNCTTTTSVNITAPIAPSITNAASTNVSCNGGLNGTITLTTTGGASPLSYNLMPGNITNATGAYTNLGANAYTVTVTDALGCSVSTTIAITEPPILTWSTPSTTNVSCNAGNDGSLQVGTSGGIGTIIYLLNPGSQTSTTGIYGTLPANTYTITATDANNCSISTTIPITQPLVLVWGSPASTNVSCNGGNDGSISITASGGTPALSYNLMPGNITNGTGVFTTLGQGSYTVTVTDANNCTLSTTITISEPPILSITNIASTIPSCVPGNDGSITVTATGGTTAYQYNIGGANQVSNVFNNVGSGIYTITVTDANNCTTTTSVNITAPIAPSITNAAITNVSCNGGINGTITLTATGGASPLSYNLMPGNITNGTGAFTILNQGSYTVTVTDGNNCTLSTTITISEPPLLSITNIVSTIPSCVPGNDGSITVTATGGTTAYQYNIGGANQVSNVFNNIGSGIYTVTVTDANNCTITTSVNITAPIAPSINNSASTNVSCNGGTNGTITLTATGSATPISFNLMPGNITNATGAYTNLGANAYTITVTDAVGCSVSTMITITEPPILTWSAPSTTNVSCNGGTNGTITLTTTGGAAPLSYNLMPGNITNATGAYTNLGANAYTITVTDAVGCSVSTTITISEPPILAWSTPSVTNVSCNGGTDGAISITASGGTPALSYNLMPGNITNGTGAFTTLSQGSYTVTVTDANNCTLSTTISITQPPVLAWSTPSVTNVSCNGGTDGAISITASGGTPALSYNLMPGNITNGTGSFTTLSQGSYTVTVTDANNCTLSTSITISEPPVLSITNIATTIPSCVPGNDGSITVTATGGTITYQYSIGGPNQASNIFNNIGSSIYTVTVTDANNCTITTSVNITAPNAPTITNAASTNVSCNGGTNGTITLTTTGGAAPLSYNLMPGNITNATGAYTNLGANAYTITVTDAVGCSVSTTITISEPPILTWSTPSVTNVSCNGGTDGAISITASGGTPALSYNLMPGNITNGTGAFTTLSQGSYTVTVTDANNCTLSTTISITQPPVLAWSTPSVTNVSCNGGTDGAISITASGGTPALSYNLMPGNITNGTGSFTTLSQGSYTVTVTDANNCTLSTSITISEPPVLSITNIATTIPSCVPGNDGSITITATGGTTTYQYNIGGPNQAANVFNNIGSGIYTVTVTDANNCTTTTSVNITAPNAPNITNAASMNVSCNGGTNGTITLTTTGGAAPLSYNLMPVNITNATGAYTNLGANAYTITVTDAVGCSVSTTITISEPPILTWSTPSVTNVSCNGGTDGAISIAASGGTPALSYNLMPGNITNATGAYTNLGATTYTVTATDANNCTLSTTISITQPPVLAWSTPSVMNVSCNGGTDGAISITASGGTPALSYNLMPGNITNGTGSFTTLSQGSYTVTVTDANNCTLSTTITITEPPILSITNIASTIPSCVPGNDGSITVTATGGTTAYQYNIGGANQASNVFNNIGSGIYTVTVTDANNCTITTSVNITAPNAPTITNAASTNVSCNGGTNGTITLTTTGGAAPLSYNLMPGNITNATGTYTNLGANAYTITVTDAVGCSVSTTITISEPPILTWSTPSVTNVSCNGGTDGAISITASGGTPALSYNLMPGNITNGTGAFTTLSQGSYTVTVTDANNCTLSTTISITQPPVLAWSTPSVTNVSCNGGTDGAISITASGGTPALSYNLMPGNITNGTGSFTTLSQGSYTVTVTDANNCTLSTSITISEPPVLSITNIATTIPSCVPGNDGSITITATGGTTTYQYNIGGPNQAANVFNNIGSGIYTVTVTDANNCTTTTSVNITAPNAPNITNAASMNVSCNGGTNGTITLTTTGGAAPLSYNLMPVNITNATGAYTNLGANAYTITVTDAVGCSVSTTITISEPPILTWSTPSVTNVSCNGGTDGAISIAASGGTPALSYNLMPGNITNATGAYTNLGATTYTVTATDANNCTLSTTISITQPPVLAWSTPSVMNVSCNGGTDGAISITASGGTPALSYNLMPGNITNGTGSFTTLSQGSYTVTVTDANNCTLSTTITITEPPILSITNIASTIPSCVPGNDGSITVTATGGTTAYQYNIGGANQASNVFNNIGSGIYTVTVTDANNCTITTSVNITAPNAPTITNAASTNVSCNGGTNGTITLTTTGGAAPLSYNLMPGNITNATGAYTNLGANAYTITVTDAVGCSVSTTITISEPPILVWSTLSTTNVSCNGGTDGAISITASGGTPALSYNLMPGNITNGTGAFTTLSQGSYTVTVTDANNCTLSTTISIMQPPVLAWSTPSVTNVSCNGGTDGAISITASGGTPALSYNLMPGNITNGTGAFTTLAQGSYTVTVTDANNCTLITTISITEPAVLSITNIATTIPSCVPGNDGSITITATGGTTTYQYNIGGPNQAANVFNNIGSGIYTVTVTDANNCTTTTSVNITAPNAPNITNAASTNVSCNGGTNGTITLTTSGGASPISYNLMPGNVTNATGVYTNLGANAYTITVTDAVGCSVSTTITISEPPILTWSTPSTTNVSCNGGMDGSISITASGGTPALSYNLMPGNITNATGSFTTLSQGSYTVTVTDANNCTLSTTITITQPPVLAWSTPSVTNVSCNGGMDGAISITASGGTPALSYNLMPGNITNATGAFTTLSQGSYTVTVTDANNCTLSTTITITEPAVLSITNIATTIPSCVPGNDGSITITATGGTMTYQYNIGGANQASNVFNNIGSGIYTVTVTDANNCTTTTSVNITAPNAPTITNAASTNVSCNGGTNGTITLTTTGGASPISYNLMPGNVTNATGAYTNLGANAYTVTATDANNCSVSTTITITQPPVLAWSTPSVTNVSCNGGMDGSISITASGGTPALSYNLMPGNITNGTGSFTTLSQGSYTVTVTDANNCTLSTTITITQPPVLAWSTPSVTNVSCNGGTDGAISITASGGTPALSYNLMPGNITNATGGFTTLSQGSYTVTVTDANNCTLSTTITITEPAVLSITNIATTIPSCVPGNDGSITITATGGTTAYQYNIGGANQASNVFNNLGNGAYMVTVTDANNCTITSSVIITAPNAPTITNAASMNVSCNGGSDGTITLTMSGGAAPLSYTLLPGPVTNATGAFTNLGANAYTVTVTDAVGCSVNTIVNITEPTQVIWDSVSQVNVSCNAGSDGSLQLNASGGTGLITYLLNPGNVSNTTGLFVNLSAITYTITATDANNCSISTTVTIAQPSVISWGAPNTTSVSCNGGSDGSLSITASGGTPALSYNLMPGNVTNGTGSFMTLAQGSYTITVTDANNCTLSTTIIVTEPPLISITNVATTNPTCVPGNDGSITVTATGGTTAYQYNIGGANQASNVFTNLGSALYTIAVTDANNCSVTSTAIISTASGPTIDSITVTEASCNPGCDATAIINATQGASTIVTYSINGTAYQISNNFGSLCSNNYTAYIQDVNGCTDTMTFVVNTASSAAIDSMLLTSTLCYGDSNATASVIASGGNGNLTYSLTPTNQNNTTGFFTGLYATNYMVTVVDSNGCQIDSNFTIMNAPSLQYVSVAATDALCFGDTNGTITVTTSGGIGTISFGISPSPSNNTTGSFASLAGNVTYTILATDANACSISTTVFVDEPMIVGDSNLQVTNVTCAGASDGSFSLLGTGGTPTYFYKVQPGNLNNTTGNFMGLAGNTYIVTITDANDCSHTTSVVVGEPNAVSIDSTSITDVSCFGLSDGAIYVRGVGGVGGFSYNLQPSNVTNTTGLFNGLVANTYTIQATDANGCSITTSLVVNEPATISIDSLDITNVSCNGLSDGAITAFSSGGNGGNMYSLNPGNISNNNGLFNGLSANVYTLAVTDNKGCSVSIIDTVKEPLPLMATYTTDSVSCFGGSNGQIQVNTNGGTQPYSLTITPGNTTNNNGLFTGLFAGSYSVNITDSNGCPFFVGPMDVYQPTQVLFTSVNTKDVTCFGDTTGEITVFAAGGTGIITFTIAPNLGTQNPSGNFKGLIATTYTLTATDANNCSTTTQVVINQNPEISVISINYNEPICHGDINGALSFTAIGGVGALLYSFDGRPYISDTVYTNLGAGTYSLSIQDTLGCILDTSLILTEPDPVGVGSYTLTPTTCEDSEDGKIVLQAIGGRPYYTYYRRPGISFNRSGIFYDLKKGLYKITIMDSAGCKFDTTFNVIANPNSMQTSITKKDLPCNGYGNEGIANVYVIGGTPPYSYLWSSTPASIKSEVRGLRFGFYFIEVIDAEGCKVIDSTYINPGECCTEIFLPDAFSPNGDGRNDVFRVIGTAGIELRQFEIFNRWGQKVWHTYNYTDSWDGLYMGEEQPIADYYFVFRYRCLTDGKEYMRKGNITLIR